MVANEPYRYLASTHGRVSYCSTSPFIELFSMNPNSATLRSRHFGRVVKATDLNFLIRTSVSFVSAGSNPAGVVIIVDDFLLFEMSLHAEFRCV